MWCLVLNIILSSYKLRVVVALGDGLVRLLLERDLQTPALSLIQLFDLFSVAPLLKKALINSLLSYT